MTKEILLFILDKHKQGATTNQIIGLVSDKFGVEMKYRYMRRIITGERGIILRRQLEKEGYDFDNAEATSNDVNLVIDKNGNQTHTTVIEMRDGQEKDPEYLLVAHGYNPDEWEITNAVSNFWQQGSAEHGTKDLYQSKITVKPKVGNFDKALSKLREEVKPVHFNFKGSGKKSNLVIPLADLHFGITTIADMEIHLHKIANIVSKVYNTVVIEQLGDLFHSSQMWTTQTMRGTMLDEVNMVQAVEDAKTFFNVLLSMLQGSKHVIIRQMAGNHSGNMEYMFMEYLKAKYPDVTIKNNIKYRDAYLLGQIGIMNAHGDFARKGLPMLFANEFGMVWAGAKQRYIHTGHYHTQKTTDEGGVIWQQFGTVKPNDKYEISNGWTLSKKTLYMLEFSETELIAEYYV